MRYIIEGFTEEFQEKENLRGFISSFVDKINLDREH